MSSRAVLCPVQPSTDCPEAFCVVCGERIVFSARNKPLVVLCNVYEDGRWDRIEHFHPEHYDGRYGEPDSSKARPTFTRTAV